MSDLKRINGTDPEGSTWTRLNELAPGCSAIVKGIDCTDSGIRRRLQDIGLIEGTRVKYLLKSPLGDPTAYLIRGAVIALRKEDAGFIIIDIGASQS